MFAEDIALLTELEANMQATGHGVHSMGLRQDLHETKVMIMCISVDAAHAAPNATRQDQLC